MQSVSEDRSLGTNLRSGVFCLLLIPNSLQLFSDRYHKHRFVSSPVSIKDLLYRQDCKILKAITSVDNHPLGSYLPLTKENKYNLRKNQCVLRKVNTERFMKSYVKSNNDVNFVEAPIVYSA